MRVPVAGATGAIGRQLVQMLRERAHEVLGITRSKERGGALRDMGAQPVICDALDAEVVRCAVAEHEPEVIVNQLTALSAPFNPLRYEQWLEPTNRLRVEGTRNLAAAATAAGTPRMISQSVAFAYRWDGEALKTEEEPLFDQDLGGRFSFIHVEDAATATLAALELCARDVLGGVGDRAGRDPRLARRPDPSDDDLGY